MLDSKIRRLASYSEMEHHHDEVSHLVREWNSHPHPYHTSSALFKDALFLSNAQEAPAEAIALRLRSLANPHLSANGAYSLLAGIILYAELLADECGYPIPLVENEASLFYELPNDDESLRCDLVHMYNLIAPMLLSEAGFCPNSTWFDSVYAAIRAIASKIDYTYLVDPWCALLLASEEWYISMIHVKPLSSIWDTILKPETKSKEGEA